MIISTNGRLLLAEFLEGHAQGLGILYDKNKKVLSKGVWKNGSIESELQPSDEEKLKNIEKTARQFNDRSFEESYKVTVVPSSSQIPDDDNKILKSSTVKTERAAIGSPRKDPEPVKEKVKVKKDQAKTDGKEDANTDKKKGKTASRSKDTKKKIVKKDVDDED